MVTFKPLTETDRTKLINALLSNAKHDIPIHMNPKDTSFVDTPTNVHNNEVIAAIQSVPCHY